MTYMHALEFPYMGLTCAPDDTITVLSPISVYTLHDVVASYMNASSHSAIANIITPVH